MNEFEEKLHRTWVQLLLNDNHKELAAIATDSDLTLAETPNELLWNNEYYTQGLIVEIPNEYYDDVINYESYCTIIEDTLEYLFRQYFIDMPKREKMFIRLRIMLIDIEKGWRDKVRELILNPKSPNQGSLVERI